MTLEAFIDELTAMPPGAQLEELRDGQYQLMGITVNEALGALLSKPDAFWLVPYRGLVLRPETGTVCLLQASFSVPTLPCNPGTTDPSPASGNPTP